MSSKDLLERLFEVEREAESIVQAARDEAGRRIDAAKTQAQRSYSEAYDAALKTAISAREASEASARAEYQAAIDCYRRQLESSRVDVGAFRRACDEALGEVV